MFVSPLHVCSEFLSYLICMEDVMFVDIPDCLREREQVKLGMFVSASMNPVPGGFQPWEARGTT